MRIFQVVLVSLVLVLLSTFVLNKKLDAGDRETARLERKMEVLSQQVEKLEKEVKTARQREKELLNKLGKLGEDGWPAFLKALKKVIDELEKVVGEDLAESHEHLVERIYKLEVEDARALKKREKERGQREREFRRDLESLGNKMSALAKLQVDSTEELAVQTKDWVNKRLGIEYKHGIPGPPRGASAADWVRYWIRHNRYVHEANYHGRRR